MEQTLVLTRSQWEQVAVELGHRHGLTYKGILIITQMLQQSHDEVIYLTMPDGVYLLTDILAILNPPVEFSA